MPIDIDRFEEGRADELRSGGRTNGERILAFLAANPEQAYTPKEIQEATDVARGSVGVVLSRLESRDLVRHRGEYWAIGTADDIGTTLSSLAAARTVTDRFGPEDPDEWGPGIESEEN